MGNSMYKIPTIVFVNEAARPVVIPAGTVPAEGLPDGWVIWNAPRPLSGEFTWQGRWTCGVFYAAGPRDQHERRNAELDAVEIRFVTNQDIDGMLDKRIAAESNYTRQEHLDAGMTIAEIAHHFGFPWHEEA